MSTTFGRSHSLGLHRILYRTRHANRWLGPALSDPTPCTGRIVYQNRSTVPVTVTAAHHHRQFSAGGWHNGKAKGKGKAKAPKPPKPPIHTARFKWATRKVSDDVYDLLESHILDSSRQASERFPVNPAALDSDILEEEDIPDTLEEEEEDLPDTHNLEHQTPPFPPDPDLDSPRKTHAAVVIDCEMVRMRGREQGLVNIAVIDFFTGDIVLRSLVRPTGPVTDWRKGVTGLNKKILIEASQKGKVLPGWGEAREKIFDVTTCETIFIGHALANDLRVLRIATDRVVDSMVMMSRAVFGDVKKFPRDWGLKTACKELLDVAVQKKHGLHDPLEDALAARELVLRCLLNPDKLSQWAASKRADVARKAKIEERKMEKKKERRKLKTENRAAKNQRKKLRRAAGKEKKKEKEEEEESSILGKQESEKSPDEVVIQD
ncbi:ribonuclease H-like domain-containing protein [Xylaria cubensis]|nr:ribonuclease H-like domain-containing protein [Xylaria cubensis]